jgi:hypothetical protein
VTTVTIDRAVVTVVTVVTGAFVKNAILRERKEVIVSFPSCDNCDDRDNRLKAPCEWALATLGLFVRRSVAPESVTRSKTGTRKPFFKWLQFAVTFLFYVGPVLWRPMLIPLWMNAFARRTDSMVVGVVSCSRAWLRRFVDQPRG